MYTFSTETLCLYTDKVKVKESLTTKKEGRKEGRRRRRRRRKNNNNSNRKCFLQQECLCSWKGTVFVLEDFNICTNDVPN